MQMAPDEPPPLQSCRTVLMQDTLFQIPNVSVTNNQLICNGAHYYIIDSTFRDWSNSASQTLVSIGGNVFSREALVFNPKEEGLKSFIDSFLSSISLKSSDVTFSLEYKTRLSLTEVACYVRQQLSSDKAQVQAIIDAHKQTANTCLKLDDQITPFINIDVFLKAKVAVCRHYALLCCILIQQLIDNKFISEGEVSLQRETLKHGAHATAHYKTKEVDWCIDVTKPVTNGINAFAISAQHLSDEDSSITPTLPMTPEAMTPPSSPIL